MILQIRAGDGQRIRANPTTGQSGRVFLREFRIPVVHHDGRLLLTSRRLVEELFGLIDDPRGIWTLG